MRWVRIVSWHAVKNAVAVDTYRTMCGRTARLAASVEDLPAAKSCETCLRIVARLGD